MKSKKRCVIFAHYSKFNIIDNYVIEYLKGLKLIANEIIFVSDANLAVEQINKITPFVSKVLAKRHGEYDFGSYKRGFNEISASDYDEVIFCNDSSYAPLFPFEEMFLTMEKRELDFWGITQNNFGYIKIKNKYEYKNEIPHIQSFFFVITKKVAESLEFNQFIQTIEAEATKEEIIIKYEQGLSETLKNFISDTYIPLSKIVEDQTVAQWKEIIINQRCPLLKIRTINLQALRYSQVKKVLDKAGSNYPSDLIKAHLKESRTFKQKIKCLPGVALLILIKRKVIKR